MLAKTLSIRITMDGIFGAMTRAAVIDFQRRHDLTADGRAGPSTLAKLREVTS
jgi:peptidoglycan hydrolase-like protein with peptidoglycan-binding domain